MENPEENHSGLQCVWSDLKENPKCIHGPTLLFKQHLNDKLKQFYVCSACRTQKLCPFYLEHGVTLPKKAISRYAEKTKKFTSQYHRQKLFIELHKILAANPSKRIYCHTCEKVFLIEDKSKHDNHDLTEGLSDHQMSHPTEILKPLVECKREAQYLFSNKSTKDIVNFLTNFGAEQVLCIGAPRIHEYISNEMEGKMSSLLLDFDGRFHNFFGSLSFCWYNLFNHHFFYDDSKGVFKSFMTQNKGKNFYIVCDPPFGGRVEAIAQTFKTISDCYKKWNNLDEEPKVLFVFPYFMQSIMRHKSSPPTVEGGMKDYKMVEYRVEYDNHPLFVKNENSEKLGSPVRIFTNIPLSRFQLWDSEYKFCNKCDRWVTLANKHCKKCNDCTSKDGRNYKHCDVCMRCVKDFWIHCSDCNRCSMVDHKCGKLLTVHVTCNRCNEKGHTERDCPGKTEQKKLKRKLSSKGNVKSKKMKRRKTPAPQM